MPVSLLHGSRIEKGKVGIWVPKLLLCPIYIVAVLVLLSVINGSCPSPAWGSDGLKLTSRQAFLRLPASFFSNTGIPLSEEDKFQLMRTGSAGQWFIRSATPDVLELEAIGESMTKVALCLYHSEGTVVAAMGSEIGPVCLSEFWRFESGGTALPLDVPIEPYLMDFFSSNRRLPADMTASFTFCPRPEGLEVRPQFWSAVGQALIRPDNAVFYIWTGHRFSKRVVSLDMPASLASEH